MCDNLEAIRVMVWFYGTPANVRQIVVRCCCNKSRHTQPAFWGILMTTNSYGLEFDDGDMIAVGCR